MLRGAQVVLRAVTREDVAQLHAWREDHDEWSPISDQPHHPTLLGDVLASNASALRTYLAAGFVVDGTMRESAWVEGQFVDEVCMSVLTPGE